MRFETKKNIKVFPNPTSDLIYIRNTEPKQTVQLFDVKGVLLQEFSTAPNSIDLANEPSGFYILKIGDEIIKIVKQ